MTPNIEDLFQQCLSELEAGESLSDVLSKYPEVRAELEPYLKTVLLYTERSLDPDREIINRSRARLLTKAAQMRAAPTRSDFSIWISRYAVGLAAALLVLISGYGLFTASAQALPGDLLYPVKRSAENLRLEFSTNEDERVLIETEFEERRTEEVLQLLKGNRVEPISFEGIVEQMGIQNWVVEGIDVRLNDETRIIGDIQISDEIEVEGETRSGGFVFATELHKHLMTLEGTVDRIDANHWRIDGRNVLVTDESDIEDGIAIGDRVRALLALADDESLTLLEVRLVEKPGAETSPEADRDEDEPQEVEFSGIVESIGATAWRVGGRQLNVDDQSDIDDDIDVGDFVTVKAELRSDGLWALDIDLERDTSEEAEEAEEEREQDDIEEDDELDEIDVSDDESDDNKDSHDGDDEDLHDDETEEGHDREKEEDDD